MDLPGRLMERRGIGETAEQAYCELWVRTGLRKIQRTFSTTEFIAIVASPDTNRSRNDSRSSSSASGDEVWLGTTGEFLNASARSIENLFPEAS